MKQTYKSNLVLLITAMIWGFAFAAQSVGMDYMGPLTFIGARYLIGTVALIPVLLVHNKMKQREKEATKETYNKEESRKQTLIAGGVTGAVLFTASVFQQIGIQYTSVGKAGFITTLYIILVPILGIFLKKKIEGKVWIGAMLAAIGMYFLCMTEKFALSFGDSLVFCCAFCYSVHILVVDHFVEKVDAVKIAFLQLFVAGILGTIAAFIVEKPSLSGVMVGLIPLLYVGVMSSGAGYTLQIIGQKGADPAIASLIMSLESVFSAIGGWLILHQMLSIKELFGCFLVFLAVVLVQIPLDQVWKRVNLQSIK